MTNYTFVVFIMLGGLIMLVEIELRNYLYNRDDRIISLLMGSIGFVVFWVGIFIGIFTAIQ